MKKFLTLATMLLGSVLAFGQGSSPSGAPIAISPTGQIIPGANVAVCTTDPGPTPAGICSPLATTFTDISLGTACTGPQGTQQLNNRTAPLVGTGCSNPGHADGLGNVVVFTAPGNYFCEYYGPGINGFFAQPCVAGGSVGSGAISGPTAKGNQVQGNGGGFASVVKPRFDVRDYTTCDGSTNATGGMAQLFSAIGPNHATVDVTGPCKVAILHQPANITLDFAPGGAIQLITNSTAPGGGAFVQGAGQSNAQASPTSTCSATLTGTSAGNAILMVSALYGTFGPDNARISSVTDGSNLYVQQMQTTLGNAPYLAAYVASSITGGTVTVTANFSHAEKNACIAWEVSGLGPVVTIDNSAFNFGTTTPFSTGTASLAAGDFVAAFGEDPNGAQTCTAGAGYTQPASSAGNVSGTSGVSLCGEYVNSGAGGSTSATQNFSSSPVASSWGAFIIGLKPGIATWNALGGINDPDLHQICLNCTGTNGVLDFTGNIPVTNVYPEWWGACGSCTATVNTPAIQASEIGAFGSKRVNGSGLNQWNKVWALTANYQINAEIQFYHVSGNITSRAQVWCSAGGGLTQTATNLRILDGQSDAYLRFDNCNWTGSSANTGALLDIGFSGAQGGDFAPQFIDFYGNSWVGNNQVAIGLLGAKEGGGAQFSNIYCYDCLASGFTTAGWQVGTPTSLAQNALAIGYQGDMQSNSKDGFACYGCGFVTIGGGIGLSSMENGFSTQTGFDMDCQFQQGPCTMEHFRSESRRLAFCSNCQLKDVFIINQAQQPNPATSNPVGNIMTGNHVSGDGAYYKVTVDGGNWGGVGNASNQVIASGGSSSTIVNTNQTLTGSVTVGTFPGASQGETMTQAVTGATGIRRNSPTNNATITGTASGSQIVFNEIMQQAVTGVTCTEQAPSPATGTSQNLICNNFSGTADSSHAWTGQSSGGVYTPSAAPLFAAANPILVLGSVTGSPDSSHIWTGATSNGQYTPTQAPQPANYTVNAFTGMFVSVYAGTNALCYGTIASNTSTTITISGGWITKYPGVQCPGPDSTSTFSVDPGWNHGTVVSGGMTAVYMNETVIDGGNGASGTFEDVIAYGGQWHMSQSASTRTRIIHGQVSRQDWYTPIGATPQAVGSTVNSALSSVIDGDWDIGVFPPGASKPQVWSNLTSGGAVMDSSAQRQNLGNRKICWNAEGGAGGTTPANEVCIGGRSDPNATTDATRSLVEIVGYLGSPAPTPNAGNGFNLTNVVGTDTNITGGPSTGNANGGGINFSTSAPGGSGIAVNSALKRWTINTVGNFFAILDNTYDIGSLAGNRPRAIYSSTAVNVGDPSFGSNQNNTRAACETNFAATTLNVGGTTTDTGLQCLPAGSVIDAVVYRITTTITTAANFTIGDASTAARFCTTQSTLTAGTTGVCLAQTGTSGAAQSTNATVRVTTNANPGAGAIRLIVYYHTWTAPTS